MPTKPLRGGTRTGGMTLGFDGNHEFAPIALLRLYNCDMKCVTFLIEGDVAELALRRQDRLVLNDPDDTFSVVRVVRGVGSSVMVTIEKKRRLS